MNAVRVGWPTNSKASSPPTSGRSRRIRRCCSSSEPEASTPKSWLLQVFGDKMNLGAAVLDAVPAPSRSSLGRTADRFRTAFSNDDVK